MTPKMKTALLGFLNAHNEGRQIYKPAGVNFHTVKALCRKKLVGFLGIGFGLTPAGVEEAERISDEAWGIGGDWIPTGETLDEIVARDLSHLK